MTEAVVRYGKDTWAGSGAPSVNHNDANRLKLKGTDIYGYLHLKSPVPRGLTVVSATLTVYAAKTSDWTGTKTLTVKRLAERVPFGKLTWNNKPGVTGAAKTVTVTGASNGQALSFDVTSHLQTVANGDPHYGWRISTDSATDHRVYGFESDYPPILTVEYALSPSQPVDLSPAGGAVSVAQPVLTFDAVDLTNPQDMSALQVQLDAAADAVSPDFDSGWVTSSVPELDLAGTAYAGLADGASIYWRARYKSGEGVEGDWSDWVLFSRAAKSALTITNPAAAPDNYVSEATPPFLHTFAGTQVAWRKWITPADDHSEILANSKKTDGTEDSWTPPAKILHDDGAYTIHVRVWDDVDRVETPGDPAYTYASRDFTLDEDATVTAPTIGTATQDGGTPNVVLTWTRGTAPDSWTVLRDGENVATLDPSDTLATGTTHTWTDPGASPQTQHTYRVRAVVNGASSPKSAAATVTTYPEGVWLLDTDRGLSVHIVTTGVDNWRRTDRVGVYRPVGGKPVQVLMGDDGISGSVEGQLQDVDGRSTAQWRADFEQMAAKPTRTYQLVAANLSLPVKIRNASATPHPGSFPTSTFLELVRFEFFEVDG